MSFLNISNHDSSDWKGYEKILLRFFFIYFFILVVPIDWKFYQELFNINWATFNFYSLFSLTKYAPQFFGLVGYQNWLFAGFIATLATIIWTFSNTNCNYDSLYYWLRVILRYRLAIGIIAYGFLKVFPLQMPFPSLSNMHTNYGDFLAWKIYFHTLGITQGYEIFLGAIEVVAGTLLLFRRTTTFGAGIIAGFTGNVFAANIAYDASEEVYSLYLVVIALFLLIYDAKRLYSLLVLEQYTIASKFEPIYTTLGLKRLRTTLKGSVFIFLIVLGVSTYANYIKEPYKLPKKTGLEGTYGFYNVREFKYNGVVIPYTTSDTNRWQNVVFEKWATISIKIAKPVKIDTSFGDVYHTNDIDRNFESAGVGGRHYFAYQADTVSKKLSLQNKNKNHASEKFQLSYRFLNDSTLVLSGVNEKKDSVYAVLDKINKKYMLLEGRRKSVKL
ncbi:DoxX family protein [Pedobacter aquae]|uniref:DoxX family protein n=1 Tax=Pedobacter aquae TaxID=2605747 RepID=A0A5C0VKU3_9SPHI|nr:DoxX family protein [Pedobacter aquae]QEK51584.1 DoxX family protein [Pedobacter aquae]